MKESIGTVLKCTYIFTCGTWVQVCVHRRLSLHNVFETFGVNSVFHELFLYHF